VLVERHIEYQFVMTYRMKMGNMVFLSREKSRESILRTIRCKSRPNRIKVVTAQIRLRVVRV
jgi:hypothetical protein